MQAEILSYNGKQSHEDQKICDMLFEIISKEYTDAESKVWHAHPVWFLEGNPIVGYHKLKDGVRLLFWSGQSFEETGLKPEWSFKAAGMTYTSLEQIDADDIKKWLKKGKQIQWDYKNIVKNKGKLSRI